MKSITVTGYRRPHLFRTLLESLVKNDLTGWQIFCRIEPSPLSEEFVKIAREILTPYCYGLAVNTERRGVRNNPFSLLKDVFEFGSEINIYLEEDLIVSPDMIALAEWFYRNGNPDQLCLSLLAGGCGSAGLISQPDHPRVLYLDKTFNSYGFVILRDAWYRHFEPNWLIDRPESGAFTGWDWAMWFYLIRQAQLHAVQPALARANHTGREDGEHMPAAFHDLAFGSLPISHSGITADEFRLHTLDEMPPALRGHVLLWGQAMQAITSHNEQEQAVARYQSAAQGHEAAAQLLSHQVHGFQHQLSAVSANLAEATARLQQQDQNIDDYHQALQGVQTALGQARAENAQQAKTIAALRSAAQQHAETAAMLETMAASLAEATSVQSQNEHTIAALQQTARLHEDKAAYLRQEIEQYRQSLDDAAASARQMSAERDALTRALTFTRYYARTAPSLLRWSSWARQFLLMGARRAARSSDWPLAEQRYRALLAANDAEPRIWLQYGHALREQSQPSLAEGAYREAVNRDGQNAELVLHLGHALRLQGLLREAHEAYVTACALDPHHSPARQALAESEAWEEIARSPRIDRTTNAIKEPA